MDITEQYQNLTTMINDNLPLRAFPIRELVQIFRQNGHPITLKTELTITGVHNSGDISGIMCVVELVDGYKLVCALTHLIFTRNVSFYSEIADYQKKRAKRIKRLNSTGLN